MIKQTTRITLLIALCASSITFAMESEDIKPVKIKSLQELALKAVLTNPRSIITQSLPAQCQIVAHGKLIDIKPLIFPLYKSKDPVTGQYQCKICGLSSANNALHIYNVGFSQDSQSLLVKSQYGDNDLSHFHRWDTARNEWETYNLDEISFEKSIDIYFTNNTSADKASVEKQFQIYTEPYCISLPAQLKFVTFNQNKNKLIIAYSNKGKSEIALYNLDDDSIIEHNLPQLCLLSAIQQEQKQGTKLQLTAHEEQLYNDLSPKFKAALEPFVIHPSLLQNLLASCKRQLWKNL